MNVVILEAGSPGRPSYELAQDKPGLYVVQPDETAVRSIKRMLEFHSDPRPVVDYRGVPLPDGAIKVFEEEAAKAPEEMPALQTSFHEKMAESLGWRLIQAEVLGEAIGLELPFPEAA